jgi:acrylyl-CoA reductase (NADPH)
MSSETYRAMIVEETGKGRFERRIGERSVEDLPAGDVRIGVRFSSLNYKDALSASGNKGVTRSYPHTPGIDGAGVVEESAAGPFRPGDEVLVTGYDLGMNTPGGFGEKIRVPASWVVPLPAGLTLEESMVLGTAGLTAAMAVSALEEGGVTPDRGEVLVTGATGGLGTLSVLLLARSGYDVVAATGKSDQKAYLEGMGARAVVPREDVTDTSGRPLLKGRWAGVVDTVGGVILATAIHATKNRGVVACCGNAASHKLETTVFPFILRGVTLTGIESAECPMEERRRLWQRLAGEWKPDRTERFASVVPLAELEPDIDRILTGGQRGRVVVDLSR